MAWWRPSRPKSTNGSEEPSAVRRALRYDPAVRYIYVRRDTRDVFMSAFKHYSGYTQLTYSLLRRRGAHTVRCHAAPPLNEGRGPFG
jgi:hypothetical protein